MPDNPSHLQRLDWAQHDWKNIKKTVDSARFLAEFGDIESSYVIAQRAINAMNRFISSLQQSSIQNKNFVDMVLVNHLPFLAQVTDFFSKPVDAVSIDEKSLNDHLQLLKNVTFTFERHLKQMVDFKKSFLAPLGLYAKPLALVFSVVLGAILFVEGVSFFMSRGQGLRGEYFKDKDLLRFVRQRIDKKIDFDWGNNAPLKGVERDGFSIRWTGTINVPSSGLVEFATQSDDGVRLWINDQKIIDNWTLHSLATNQATLHLEAGHHRIRLEYFDSKYKAIIRLLWKHGKMKNSEVIPSRYLSHK